MPDFYLDQMSPDAMLKQAGLDTKGIIAAVFSALGRVKAKPALA